MCVVCDKIIVTHSTRMASLLSLITAATVVSAAAVVRRDYPTLDLDPLASCPGYTASNVVSTGSGLKADLKLAGEACNAYGTDLKELTLEVSYDTGMTALS